MNTPEEIKVADTTSQTEVTAQPSESKATTEPTLEEKLAQLEKTNQRLLAESKDYKAKFQSIKDEVDKKEKENLTVKEDWKKLLEKERAERETERNNFKTFKHHNLNKLLEYEILKHAPDVQDVNLVKQALPTDMINAFEEDYEIKFSGIKEGLEKVKKEKTFLFKPTTIPQMTSAKPGSQKLPSANGAMKTPQEMTRDELLAYMRSNPNLT